MSLSDIYEKTFDESHGAINDTCPEYPGDLVTEDGATTCTKCGLIVDERRSYHGLEHFSGRVADTRGPKIADYYSRK